MNTPQSLAALTLLTTSLAANPAEARDRGPSTADVLAAAREVAAAAMACDVDVPGDPDVVDTAQRRQWAVSNSILQETVQPIDAAFNDGEFYEDRFQCEDGTTWTVIVDARPGRDQITLFGGHDVSIHVNYGTGRIEVENGNVHYKLKGDGDIIRRTFTNPPTLKNTVERERVPWLKRADRVAETAQTAVDLIIQVDSEKGYGGAARRMPDDTQ